MSAGGKEQPMAVDGVHDNDDVTLVPSRLHACGCLHWLDAKVSSPVGLGALHGKAVINVAFLQIDQVVSMWSLHLPRLEPLAIDFS